jgi:hypothetical protein
LKIRWKSKQIDGTGKIRAIVVEERLDSGPLFHCKSMELKKKRRVCSFDLKPETWGIVKSYIRTGEVSISHLTSHAQFRVENSGARRRDDEEGEEKKGAMAQWPPVGDDTTEVRLSTTSIGEERESGLRSNRVESK